MQKLRDIINQYKVSLLILGSFLAVLVIGIGFYSWQAQHKELQTMEAQPDPYKGLNDLEGTSQSVTQTSEKEQLETLNKLGTGSKKVSSTSTIESQMRVLQALERQNN